MQPIYIAFTERFEAIDSWILDDSLTSKKEPFWVAYQNKRRTMKHNNKKIQMSSKEKVEKRKQKKAARKKNRA
jgi:hypothetical protein